MPGGGWNRLSWRQLERRATRVGECLIYPHRGTRQSIARQYWIRRHGPIPPYKLIYNEKLNSFEWASDLEICHTCDKGRCIEDKHLWIGTHSENMQDAVRKGRHKTIFVKGNTFAKGNPPNSTSFKKGHDLGVPRIFSLETRKKMSNSAKKRCDTLEWRIAMNQKVWSKKRRNNDERKAESY